MADFKFNPEQEATIVSVYNGEMRSSIIRMRAQANELDQQLIDYRYRSSIERDPAKKSRADLLIKKLEENLLTIRKSINELTEAHNTIAGWIQTYSFNKVRPQLAGLGIIVNPATAAIITAIAVAVGITASIMLDKAAKLALAAQGKVDESRTIVGELADLLKGASGLVGTFAIVAGISLAGFLIWRNWGSISGAFKGRSAAKSGGV